VALWGRQAALPGRPGGRLSAVVEDAHRQAAKAPPRAGYDGPCPTGRGGLLATTGMHVFEVHPGPWPLTHDEEHRMTPLFAPVEIDPDGLHHYLCADHEVEITLALNQRTALKKYPVTVLYQGETIVSTDSNFRHLHEVETLYKYANTQHATVPWL